MGQFKAFLGECNGDESPILGREVTDTIFEAPPRKVTVTFSLPLACTQPHRVALTPGGGAAILGHGNRFKKPLRRYRGNEAGGKVRDVAGNDIVRTNAFPHDMLNAVLEIVPFKIQRQIDVVVRYGGGVEDVQQVPYGFTGAGPSNALDGDVKNIRYGRSGNIPRNDVFYARRKTDIAAG